MVLSCFVSVREWCFVAAELPSLALQGANYNLLSQWPKSYPTGDKPC